MTLFFGLLFLLALYSMDSVEASEYEDNHYVNSWVAEVPGGEEVARQVAEQHGYRVVRTLDFVPDHYELERSDTPKRSRRSADHHTKRLVDDERVLFVEQQEHRHREKRGILPKREDNAFPINDPQYKRQWYLNQEDSQASRRGGGRSDLNVQSVWERNITGRGIVLTVVDDGIEHTHDDLKRNYKPDASYDLNEDDPDPMPRYDPTNENKHGTRCAGEIAMAINNGVCGVGIAYDAGIGGLKILDGSVTDAMEARSLSFNRNYIDIYSSSWGPSDNGKKCEGPGKLTQKVLEGGVKEGRNGKGSIFVVASGNGGSNGDNCNCDGYTSSIYTISVSSSSEERRSPYYTEKCSSTLVSGSSSGSYSEHKVVSSDLHNQCTDNHSGTSAAAPMVAGVIALMLQANPNLTWMDVQTILAITANYDAVSDNTGWYKNGAGLCVNTAFGFGLVRADMAVDKAIGWKPVDEQKTCVVEPSAKSGFPREFKSGEFVEVAYKTDGCQGQDNSIAALTSVQVEATICHSKKRGYIYAEIESPSGTITPVMMERPNDDSKDCFNQWMFMSLHNWAENPQGTWYFRVADRTSHGATCTVKSARLFLHGTSEIPEYVKDLPQNCAHLLPYADTRTNTIPDERDKYGTKSSTDTKHPSMPHFGSSSPKASTHTEDSQAQSPIKAIKDILQVLSHG